MKRSLIFTLSLTTLLFILPNFSAKAAPMDAGKAKMFQYLTKVDKKVKPLGTTSAISTIQKVSEKKSPYDGIIDEYNKKKFINSGKICWKTDEDSANPYGVKGRIYYWKWNIHTNQSEIFSYPDNCKNDYGNYLNELTCKYFPEDLKNAVPYPKIQDSHVCAANETCFDGACVPRTCDDSDKGKVYAAAGSVTEYDSAGNAKPPIPDTCVTADLLAEQYCDGGLLGKPATDYKSCSELGDMQCKNGACVERDCKDSDGGEDFTKFGTVTEYNPDGTVKGEPKPDVCKDGTTVLIEGTCKQNPTNIFVYAPVEHDCELEEKVCMSGRCKFPCCKDSVVNFEDSNLENAILNKMGKAEGEKITCEEAIGISELILNYSSISDLSGIECFTNLIWLGLNSNQISNIQPLAGLTNLKGLYFAFNNVSDISPLAGLNLHNLTSSYNQISDISPLAGLANLGALALSYNQISNIETLAGLTNLSWLGLNNNQISNIKPLAGLTKLEILYLSDNQINDIQPLAGLTNLKYLELGANQISNIQPLTNLSGLTSLALSSNQIGNNIQPLAGLTSLVILNLHYNQISDILPLVQNSGLGTGDKVYLGYNPLSQQSINTYIPQLQGKGVLVVY